MNGIVRKMSISKKKLENLKANAKMVKNTRNWANREKKMSQKAKRAQKIEKRNITHNTLQSANSKNKYYPKWTRFCCPNNDLEHQ